jgi:PAS domain S-box-containing protein
LQALRALGVLFLCFPLPARVGAQVTPVRRVLILNELGPASPVIALVDGQIRAGLESSPYQIELYIESLETTLFPDPVAQKEFRDWYLHKYRDRKPDVIIAVGPSPIRFLAESHEKFFPNTPVVFCISTEEWAGHPKLDSSFTGVWELVDMPKVVDVVLKLKPQTKHVVVVGGVAAYDRANEAAIRNGLRDYLPLMDVTYLTELDIPTLLERIKRLPKDTIILNAGVSEDAAGTHYIVASQSTPLIIKAANAPVFAMGDMEMGQGDVGGYMVSFAKESNIVATDVLRILNGEKLQDIPIVRGANVYMFDWRALRRWGLNEGALPPGSVVLNRPPSFWQLYKRYVLAGIFVLLAQSLAIFALLWQRAKRRKTQALLLESQNQLNGIVESAMDALIAIDDEHRIVVFNAAAEKMFGCPVRDAIGSPIDRFIPEHFRAAQRQHIQHLGDTDATTRALGGLGALWGLRKNGQEFPIEASISQVEVSGGKLFTFIIRDVTERKLVEEALSSVNRRLIEAQEQERARIARELHDDLSQRMALLHISLEQFEEDTAWLSSKARQQLHDIAEVSTEVLSSIHDLSHQLHPSKLDTLGLIASLTGLCREFSEQHHLLVQFVHHDIPGQIPKDVTLCLFRIVQEALQNVVKHSGASEATVQLSVHDDRIELAICDPGVGFNPESAEGKASLGLISMHERLRLVGGHLAVESEPSHGTRIHARVPFFTTNDGVTNEGKAHKAGA